MVLVLLKRYSKVIGGLVYGWSRNFFEVGILKEHDLHKQNDTIKSV